MDLTIYTQSIGCHPCISSIARQDMTTSVARCPRSGLRNISSHPKSSSFEREPRRENGQLGQPPQSYAEQNHEMKRKEWKIWRKKMMMTMKTKMEIKTSYQKPPPHLMRQQSPYPSNPNSQIPKTGNNTVGKLIKGSSASTTTPKETTKEPS